MVPICNTESSPDMNGKEMCVNMAESGNGPGSWIESGITRIQAGILMECWCLQVKDQPIEPWHQFLDIQVQRKYDFRSVCISRKRLFLGKVAKTLSDCGDRSANLIQLSKLLLLHRGTMLEPVVVTKTTKGPRPLGAASFPGDIAKRVQSIQ